VLLREIKTFSGNPLGVGGKMLEGLKKRRREAVRGKRLEEEHKRKTAEWEKGVHMVATTPLTEKTEKERGPSYEGEGKQDRTQEKGATIKRSKTDKRLAKWVSAGKKIGCRGESSIQKDWRAP